MIQGNVKLDSPAWLLRGISALPGRLSLVGGTLSLTLHGTGSAWDWQLRKLDRSAAATDLGARLRLGQPALLFRERLENVVVGSPWYYFSGGLIVRTARGSWRISFGRPAGAAGLEGLGEGADELATAIAMRRLGSRWLQVLRQAGPIS